MKKSLIFCSIFIVLSGCATGYKPNGFIGNGGFEDVELAPNYFRVTFRGNEKTSKERATDFTLLRASDLMLERNCPSFVVVKSSEEVRKGSLFIPQTQTTYSNATAYGNTAYGTATTTTMGGGFATLHFPKVTMEVKCTADLPDLEKNIYDVKFINKSLKTKYKIDGK